MTNVGENVQYTVEGDILTIKINLKERHGRSVSGKTFKIASTNGNSPVIGDNRGAILGLNVYSKQE